MADIFADDFTLGNVNTDTTTTTTTTTTTFVDVLGINDDVRDDNLSEGKHEQLQQPNPFSFSSFMNKFAHVDDDDNDDNDDIAGGVSSSVFDKDLRSSATNREEVNETKCAGGKDDNPFRYENFVTSSATSSRNTNRKLQIIDDDDGDDDDSSCSSNGVPSSMRVNQGDVDATAGGTGVGVEEEWDEITDTLNGTFASEDSEESLHLLTIEKLSKENVSLRNELSKLRDEFLEYRRTANKRVGSMQKELEKVRRKEAEETRNLDNVVQMVEDNLQKTTSRASSAEATVLKLREEIKVLKHENLLHHEKQLEQSEQLHTVEEKSRNVAQLMRTAAHKTEPHVKQLQSGMASLRFFAQQFDDICKVAEVNTTQDHPT